MYSWKHYKLKKTSEGGFTQHQSAVHEGVNTLAVNATFKQIQGDILLNTKSLIPLKAIQSKISQKGSLYKQKRAVHEDVKYLCWQCGQQFSQKGNLDKHKRVVQEGVRYNLQAM